MLARIRGNEECRGLEAVSKGASAFVAHENVNVVEFVSLFHLVSAAVGHVCVPGGKERF